MKKSLLYFEHAYCVKTAADLAVPQDRVPGRGWFIQVVACLTWVSHYCFLLLIGIVLYFKESLWIIAQAVAAVHQTWKELDALKVLIFIIFFFNQKNKLVRTWASYWLMIEDRDKEKPSRSMTFNKAYTHTCSSAAKLPRWLLHIRCQQDNTRAQTFFFCLVGFFFPRLMV